MIAAARLVNRSRAEDLGRRVVVDDNEQIDVAVGPCFTTRRRAKQDDPLRGEMRDDLVEQFRGEERRCTELPISKNASPLV